jgi:hypothetical protein
MKRTQLAKAKMNPVGCPPSRIAVIVAAPIVVSPSEATLRLRASPWPTPEREDQCRAGDPEPGDAKHVDPCEQEYGQCRAEIMENGAYQEE